MIIIPAIDLKDGKCVRLRQGCIDDSTIYGQDPVRMALRWQSEGGKYLHVVDLDGAFKGFPVHSDVVCAIAKALDIPVETGGGLREDSHIDRMLDGGVSRVILGTRALADGDELRRLVLKYGGDRLAVGIDARDGFVQIKGWVETSSVRASDLARRVCGAGVGTIIYTDTSTDGMLSGPNLGAIREICQTQCDIIASGGVSSAKDVRDLASLGLDNLKGVIVGKALYEGGVTLKELQEAAGQD